MILRTRKHRSGTWFRFMLLSLPALCGVCTSAVSGAPSGTDAVATAIVVPANVTLVRRVQAGGEQIYACRISATQSYNWTLVGPNALLFNDDGSIFGKHEAGPRWTAADGGTVIADGAAPIARVALAGAVPELELRVVSAPHAGVLADVTIVTRTQTAGGLAPATGCDAADADRTIGARYTAVYAFYR